MWNYLWVTCGFLCVTGCNGMVSSNAVESSSPVVDAGQSTAAYDAATLAGEQDLFDASSPTDSASAPTMPPPQPHLARTGSNLLTNASFNGNTGWNLTTATYDDSTSRTAGSGSVKIPVLASGTPIVGANYRIPVVPGTLYTFGGYMRADLFPQKMAPEIDVYDENGTYLYAASQPYSFAAANDWEEFAFFYEAKPDEAFVAVYVYTDSSITPNPSGNVWVDELYFGEGIGFDQPPTPKKAFVGGTTRVDALGNFEILQNGEWQPFFPFSVWSLNLPNWPEMSAQGFNTAIDTNDIYPGRVNNFVAAKNAASTFNPNGMMLIGEISAYIMPEYYNAGFTLSALQTAVDQVLADPDVGRMISWLWDNEMYTQWSVPVAVTNLVKQEEIDVTGQRQRPIMMLGGRGNWARMYNDLVDDIGNYPWNPTVQYMGYGRLWEQGNIVNSNLEQQTNPGGFINLTCVGAAEDARRGIYSGLIAGAKAITFWRDPMPYTSDECDMAGPGGITGTFRLDSLPVWSEIPKLRREIDALLPVIREPHWTTWTVSASNPLTIGTRDYNGSSYIFVVNPYPNPVTSVLTISGLPARIQSAADFFSGHTIATVTNSQFTVTLPACTSSAPSNCTAVYQLAAK